jgi:periplasmic protein TonB
MRKDLIIGLSVSAAVHYSMLFLTQAPSAPPPRIADTADVVKIEMPELPPEEPDKKPADETPDEDAVQSSVAPPTLVDIPNVVPNAVFVITPEPPPPPGVNTAKGVVTIPTNPRPAGWGKGWSNLFDISQLDQQPVPRFQSQPQYPYEMRRAAINGTVTVGFICDSEGNVRDPYVMNSTHREFEVPAVQAVSKWKFKPGRRGGRNVNTRMSVPLVFTCTD